MGARSPARTPRRRAYSSAAGSPLISLTTRRDGIGLGDDEPLLGGHEVLRLERLHAQGRGDQREHRPIAQEAATGVDVRAGEAEAVAGGAADHGDLAERLLDREGQQLLTRGEPVDQEEGEAAPVGARRRDAVELLQQVAGDGLAVADLEPSQPFDRAGDGRTGAGGEAHAREAPVDAAGRPDLPGGGAPDHRDAGEAALHLRGQRLAVVGAGAEEDHERHVRLRDAGEELLHGVARIGRARLRGADAASDRSRRALAWWSRDPFRRPCPMIVRWERRGDIDWVPRAAGMLRDDAAPLGV